MSKTRKVLLYIYNRVDFLKFKELWERAYFYEEDEDYLINNFDKMFSNTIEFLLNHDELLKEIENEIESIGYKG